MKIQLVSYLIGLSNKKKIKLTAEIINESDAELIFFSGNTVKSIADALEVAKHTINHKSVAVIEVSSVKISDLGSTIYHCPFLIKNSELVNMHTHQLFACSDTIKKNDYLAESLIHELETNRQFNVDGYKCLLLECGENNILRNIQSEKNKPEVRIDDDELASRFAKVINNCDIILNVIHKPQYGTQNKMHKRREYFSDNGRFYFSTNNCDRLSEKLKSVQYAYYDGNPIDTSEIDLTKEGCMIRSYLINNCLS